MMARALESRRLKIENRDDRAELERENEILKARAGESKSDDIFAKPDSSNREQSSE